MDPITYELDIYSVVFVGRIKYYLYISKNTLFLF